MVTAIKCVDGKKHHWKFVSSDSIGYVEHVNKWCGKCGCITEFYRGSGSNCLKYRRCIDIETKTYYIEIPKYLKGKKNGR